LVKSKSQLHVGIRCGEVWSRIRLTVRIGVKVGISGGAGISNSGRVSVGVG